MSSLLSRRTSAPRSCRPASSTTGMTSRRTNKPRSRPGRPNCASAAQLPRRHVDFDDQFFESLSRRVSGERDGARKPARTDVLVYVIMPLMDLLADDYERNTLAVDHDDNLRVLVQTSPFVNWVQLWCYIDGDDGLAALRASDLSVRGHRRQEHRARQPSQRVVRRCRPDPRRSGATPRARVRLTPRPLRRAVRGRSAADTRARRSTG